jgi:hypothetical protein
VQPCLKNVFVLDESTEYLYHEPYTGVDYSLTFNTTGTNLVKFTYVDPSGDTSYGRLWVYLQGAIDQATVCNTTVNAASGTILCNLTNYTGGSHTFLANAYLSQSPDKWFEQLSITIEQAWKTYGFEGVLLAIFLFGMIALAAIWNPTASVVGTVFGLIAIKILGFMAVPWAVIVAAVVVGAVIIWRVSD